MGPPFPTAGILVILPELCAKLNASFQYLPEIKFAFKNPYDNAVAENFFSCLKCELVHLRRFDSRRAAQADLFTYIEAFYNTIRPHSSLGWLPPRDFEKRLLDWEAA